MVDIRLSSIDGIRRKDDNFKKNEKELLEYIFENRGEIPMFDYKYSSNGQYCLDVMDVYMGGALLVSFRENLIDPTDIYWNIDYSDKEFVSRLPDIFYLLLQRAKKSREEEWFG